MEALWRALRLLALAGRTLLRGFGLSFVALVALLAGLFLYGQRFLNPERARAILVEQLEDALHREVLVDRVVLTPRGVRIRGLRVRALSPDAEDLLVCDSAVLTIKLKPLLRRRIELEAVRLDSPRISVARDESGVWEIADLFTSTAARRGGLPFDLAAAETRVENGVLRVEDRFQSRRLSLEGLSARVDDFSLTQPFPFSASFSNSVTFGTRTVSATVSGEGWLDLAGLRWSSATARAERFSAVVDGTALEGEALVEGFERPRVTFTASLPALGPEQWRRHFEKEWPLSLPPARLNGVVSSPSAGRVDVERLEVRAAGGRLAAEGSLLLAASTPSVRVSLRVEDLDLAQAGSWSPSWARRELQGRLDGRVSLSGWAGRLQAESAELAVKGFGGRFTRHRVEGLDGRGWASDEFTVAGATISAGRVSAFDNVFDQLAGSASLRKQDLVLEGLSTRWGASTLKLRGRVQRVSNPKEIAISGTLDRLVWEDAQRLVTAFKASVSTRTAVPENEPRTWVRVFKYAIPKRFPDTVGHVKVGEVRQAHFWCRDVSLLWALRGVTPQLDSVSGEARLSLGAGRVADIQAVQDSHRFLRLVFLPFIFMHKMNSLSVFSAATAYPKTLDFSRIEGEYAVSKGVAATRYFHVDSGQLVAYAEGDADFGRERVDMNILTRLTSYRGTLPEWWVDELGRPAIGFRVKGDLNQPELEPRFSKIGSGEIERKVEEGRARGKSRFEAAEKLKTL